MDSEASDEGSKVSTTDRSLRELAFTTPWGFLALGFGSGLAPRLPGTFGTIAAIPLAVVLASLPLLLALFIVLTLFAVGVPLCRVTAAAMGREDPGAIVWDEIVGFALVAILTPRDDEWGWIWLLAAFFAFRFFDIVKPWPIKWFERRLSGGFGIMFDDIVAAVYTIALLRLSEWIAFRSSLFDFL